MDLNEILIKWLITILIVAVVFEFAVVAWLVNKVSELRDALRKSEILAP